MARVESRIAQIRERINLLNQSAVSSVGTGWGSGLSNVGAGPRGTSFSSEFDSVLAGALSSSASRTGVVDGNRFWGETHTEFAASTPAAAPAELAIYGNGRVPAAALTPIGVGEHRLWGPAASAFSRMRADAAAQGLNIGVTDSYRSYDDQVDLIRTKGLYANGGLGAVPGTSAHGWGLALDIDVDERGQAWLRANAGQYGFVETTPREPWHWEFRT